MNLTSSQGIAQIGAKICSKARRSTDLVSVQDVLSVQDIHVLADALTSVTAIIALTAGKFLSWFWLDAVMGIVGSAVVSVWAYGLVRDTSGILLDRTPESSDLPDEIRRAVESDGDSLVTDLHVWQVGAGKFAAIVSIVAHDPKPVETYRALFREHEELVHVTVEVQQCHEQEDSHASV